MSSLSRRLREQEKGKALNLLKELTRKIKREEVDVLNVGSWMEGNPDRWAFIFHVQDSEKREESEQSQ